MQDPIYNRIEGQARPSLWAASGFVWLAAVGLWISTLAELLLKLGGNVLPNLLYYLPFVGLPLLLYARRHPGLGEAMRLNPLPGLSALTLAPLGAVSVYVASALSAAWGAGLDALGLTSPGSFILPQTEGELILSILTLAAMPALFEELLFRGFALSAWESRGTAFAIGVTAALFALLHGNLYGMPAYLLVGAVAGYATYALDSVYAGIVYHTFYNAFCLVIPYLANQSQAAEDIPLTASQIASLALQSLMMLGLLALLISTLRARALSEGRAPIPRVRRPLSDRERLMLLAAVGTMTVTAVIVMILTIHPA